jgi:hypothetical protein
MHRKRNTAAHTLTAEWNLYTEGQAHLAVHSKYGYGINGSVIDKFYYGFYVKRRIHYIKFFIL